MINSIRRRGKGSRFASLAVVACMTVGLGLVGVTPALAADPPASFHPDEDSTETSMGNILSDRFDGFDQLAHLTAVATAAADRVDWYACPESVTDPVDATELGQCNVFIGSDTTPNVPATSTLTQIIDEAYEFFWDIPAGLDNLERDILVLSCTGAGTTLTGPGQNCQQSLEESIQLDDASGGATGQSTAGEITKLCTVDLVVAAAGECHSVGTTQGSAARGVIDARFENWEHGDPLPDTGFVLRATTSPDVDEVWIGIDPEAHAGKDIDKSFSAPAFEDNCERIEVFTDRYTWECVFTNADVGDGTYEAGVHLFENLGGAVGPPPAPGTGTGFCGGGNDGPTVDGEPDGPPADCQLDAHYTAVIPRQATTVTQSWIDSGHGHIPPSPPANAGCEAGETPTKSHSDADLSETLNGEICVTDNFGDRMPGVAVTEEVTAPGEFNGGHDHDGDGRLDMFHATTGGAGTAAFTVQNFNATPGTATVTSCVENEPTAGATGHGCANETIKDTLTYSWATTPTQVFLAYAGTASNPNDPCRTGATIANGTVGQVETLVVCTFDSQGNPVSTNVDASRMQWTITGAHGNDAPSVRFNGTPPDETGGNAQATVSITDIGPGDNFIEVTLLDVNGDFQDDFFVEKDVAGGKKGNCQQIKNKIKKKKAQRRIARASGDLAKVKKLTRQIRRLRKALRRCKRRNA